MRTTLTIEDDVAVRLERLRRSGRTLKEVVNEALRAGLDDLEKRRRPAALRDYTVAQDLGKPYIDNIDDVQGILDLVEGPERR